MILFFYGQVSFLKIDIRKGETESLKAVIFVINNSCRWKDTENFKECTEKLLELSSKVAGYK